MKKILLISLFLFGATSLFAQVQPYPKQLKPFSAFNGDRHSYLQSNFGYGEGYDYHQENLENLLNDLEVPVLAIHFQLQYLSSYKGYSPNVIRLFFDDPDVVEKSINIGNASISNITVTVDIFTENKLIDNMYLLSPIFEGHTENFLIPFDDNVKKLVGKITANGIFYRLEFP